MDLRALTTNTEDMEWVHSSEDEAWGALLDTEYGTSLAHIEVYLHDFI